MCVCVCVTVCVTVTVCVCVTVYVCVCVCVCVTVLIAGSGTSAIFNEDLFMKRATVLKKYADEKRELQLQILYALQVAITKLEHPPSEHTHPRKHRLLPPVSVCTHVNIGPSPQ